jgi:hypothetical protein
MMAKKAAVADEPQEEQPKAEPKTGTAENAGKTIDQRMADLLKDHKRMGAR